MECIFKSPEKTAQELWRLIDENKENYPAYLSSEKEYDVTHVTIRQTREGKRIPFSKVEIIPLLSN